MHHYGIQECIKGCQQTINQLSSVASHSPSPQVQSKLSEAIHHLRHSMEDCNFAMQRINRQHTPVSQQQGQFWWTAQQQPFQFQQTTPFTSTLHSQQSPVLS